MEVMGRFPGIVSEEERERRRAAACVKACAGISTAELERGIVLDLVAACIHLRHDLRVREILDRLTAAPSRPIALARPARNTPAPAPSDRPFRLGLRVRSCVPRIPPARGRAPAMKGVVTGFSREADHVRITRDGRTSSESLPAAFWEEDPDFRDANERLSRFSRRE